MKQARLSFAEWLSIVNAMTLAAYHMSIYELEDDIPREILERAHAGGLAPRQFVDDTVTPVFFPEGYDDSL